MPVAEARQLEYLERLRERNRLRWELQQRTADQQRSAIRQREAGFDLFLSGANAERIKGKKASQQMRAAATQGVTAPEGLRQHLETRGRWQQQTIALLASDGTQLCARPVRPAAGPSAGPSVLDVQAAPMVNGGAGKARVVDDNPEADAPTSRPEPPLDDPAIGGETCDRETCVRETYDRETCDRETCDRETYDGETCDRETCAGETCRCNRQTCNRETLLCNRPLDDQLTGLLNGDDPLTDPLNDHQWTDPPNGHPGLRAQLELSHASSDAHTVSEESYGSDFEESEGDEMRVDEARAEVELNLDDDLNLRDLQGGIRFVADGFGRPASSPLDSHRPLQHSPEVQRPRSAAQATLFERLHRVDDAKARSLLNLLDQLEAGEAAADPAAAGAPNSIHLRPGPGR